MRTKKAIQPGKPTFAIVVDGETEFWYFQMLIRNERDKLNVRIKPELPTKKSLSDQFKLVKELAKEYTKTFWVVDLDVIHKETREAKAGSKPRLQEFAEYINVVDKKYTDKIVVIVNNPCLEFWLLLHFEQTARMFENCPSVESQLKKHLKDYEKTEKFYTKQNHDIYLRLKPHMKAALSNAKKLGRFDPFASNNAISEMYLFFEERELKG